MGATPPVLLRVDADVGARIGRELERRRRRVSAVSTVMVRARRRAGPSHRRRAAAPAAGWSARYWRQ
jgi:hypothetical protein